MTTPDEELQSLKYAEEFLISLATGKEYAGVKFTRVPETVKRYASSILRHYPSQGQIDRRWGAKDH